MPLHLCSPTSSEPPRHSRRRFLQAAGAVSIVCNSTLHAEEAATDDAHIYLLNDTHIGEKHPPDSPVPVHLRQAVTELVTRPRKPACVLINGDLALKDGQPGDYRHFAKLIKPLRDARISTHLTLGNHDHRGVFYKVMQEQRATDSPIASRHISVVSTKWANFFLLDSLTKTMVTQGTIGKEQRQWLAKALDAYADKPAIIVAHHNPRLGGDPLHFPGGLIDSQELWDVLLSRKHVKAYIHGHIHDRTHAEHQGIHIINTPATSYVADPKKSTTGWTIAKLEQSGATLTTRTTDTSHPWNGETAKLQWRPS